MPSTDKPASPVIPSLAPALLAALIVSTSSSSEGIKILLDLFDITLSAAAAATQFQLETDAHNSDPKACTYNQRAFWNMHFN